QHWWCGGPGNAESAVPSSFESAPGGTSWRLPVLGPYADVRADVSPGSRPFLRAVLALSDCHLARLLGTRKQKLMWIVRLSLRRPYTIAVLCALIGIFGVLSASRMKTDILPAIDIPVVIVVWNYPGLSTEDMERRVVFISERAMSNTVSGITRIDSQSMNSLGILKVYFEPGSDIGGAIAQIVAVSLTASRIMPPGITPPTTLRHNALHVRVAQTTHASKTLPEQQLFEYALNVNR